MVPGCWPMWPPPGCPSPPPIWPPTRGGRAGSRWRPPPGYRPVLLYVGRAPQYYPPITSPAATSISARFLSVDERIVIADLRRAGRSLRSIAAELGRSAGSISRELGRNSMNNG